jgi:hypothetical protein
MIRPSRINGHSHDGHPGHADIAARFRKEVNDRTKLTVAIPTVSHTAAVRLRRTNRNVRNSSSVPSQDSCGAAGLVRHQDWRSQPRREFDPPLSAGARAGPADGSPAR